MEWEGIGLCVVVSSVWTVGAFAVWCWIRLRGTNWIVAAVLFTVIAFALFGMVGEIARYITWIRWAFS